MNLTHLGLQEHTFNHVKHTLVTSLTCSSRPPRRQAIMTPFLFCDGEQTRSSRHLLRTVLASDLTMQSTGLAWMQIGSRQFTKQFLATWDPWLRRPAFIRMETKTRTSEVPFQTC